MRAKIVNSLNSTLEIIKSCIPLVLDIKDQQLMEEVSLSLLTHEGICVLLETEGTSENVVKLTGELELAVRVLYSKVIKADKSDEIKLTQFNMPKSDRNLPN